MNKQEKKEAIDELHEKFARAKTAVVTGYSGINVEQDHRTSREAAYIEGRVPRG